MVMLFSTLVSKEDLRFRFVLEQQTDTSCGISSVATLLSLYRGVPAPEDQLIKQFADKFSDTYRVTFADMRDMLSHYGVASFGARMSFSQLLSAAGLYSPLIVHLSSTDGHFALLLHTDGEWVALADPSAGLRILHSRRFKHEWTGVALLVEPLSHKLALHQSAAQHAASRVSLITLWANSTWY